MILSQNCRFSTHCPCLFRAKESSANLITVAEHLIVIIVICVFRSVGIPALLDVEDMVRLKKPEPRSVQCYVQMIFSKYRPKDMDMSNLIIAWTLLLLIWFNSKLEALLCISERLFYPSTFLTRLAKRTLRLNCDCMRNVQPMGPLHSTI